MLLRNDISTTIAEQARSTRRQQRAAQARRPMSNVHRAGGGEWQPGVTRATPGPQKESRPPGRHLALLIETSGSYGRGLLQGIARYNREHGGWSTFVRPQGIADPPPAWLETWRGDGVIARIHTAEMAQMLLSLDVPVVNLRGMVPGLPFPNVTVDNAQVARLAAQHLLDRGLEHFAFCGRPAGGNPVLDQRYTSFTRQIRQAGRHCHTFNGDADDCAGWDQAQERLVEWIAALPKPVGIMACNDERGLEVLDACRRCAAAVPDEIAVIGVDNDEALCNLSTPPLSSVDVNAEGVGYAAAELLDRMMAGEKAPARSATRPIKIAPRGVVTRRSTDVIASEDEEVRRAAWYIRANACKGLQVMDVLEHVGLSRASLQLRMKRTIGRTIHQEIQRVRLATARKLLAMSDLTIKQVARESGFASVQYMTRVFHATTGETPARYRHRRMA
jgi:LacI family transcriptional regulator